jgi:hypothetical protein
MDSLAFFFEKIDLDEFLFIFIPYLCRNSLYDKYFKLHFSIKIVGKDFEPSFLLIIGKKCY